MKIPIVALDCSSIDCKDSAEVEFETSNPSNLGAKYEERTETPAPPAPVPEPPVLLIERFVKTVVESAKYSCTPTLHCFLNVLLLSMHLWR